MSNTHPDPLERTEALRPTVLLVGGTGLVGHELLCRLLADPDIGEVRALVRRPVSAEALLRMAPQAMPGVGKLRIGVIDFERLAQHAEWFDADWVASTLGTTIAQAGSRPAFRRVDLDYPLAVMQLARAQGARRAMLVSAVGARATSRVFYNRVKGELEEAVRGLGFEHVSVAQPSLLAGARPTFRLGERVGLALGWLMPSPYKPVAARQVAAGLLASAKAGEPGWHVLTNTALRGMG